MNDKILGYIVVHDKLGPQYEKNKLLYTMTSFSEPVTLFRSRDDAELVIQKCNEYASNLKDDAEISESWRAYHYRIFPIK